MSIIEKTCRVSVFLFFLTHCIYIMASYFKLCFFYFCMSESVCLCIYMCSLCFPLTLKKFFCLFCLIPDCFHLIVLYHIILNYTLLYCGILYYSLDVHICSSRRPKWCGSRREVRRGGEKQGIVGIETVTGIYYKYL